MNALFLEQMVHGGLALGRLEGGQVALVRGGLPGETVEAELGAKAGVLQGRVSRVLDPSPDRVEASAHPGLDYSFIAYERQLALKREVVADALRRASHEVLELPPTVAAPKSWGYRHAVQPALTPKGLGYRQPESRKVVILEEDPVAHASINRGWALFLATWRDHGAPEGLLELAWRCNTAGELTLALIGERAPRHYVPLAEALVAAGIRGVSHARADARGRFRRGVLKIAGKRLLMQRYGSFEVSVSATSFAQPNPAAASLLFARLAPLVGSGKHAVDLYAGSGVIAFHLAQAFEEVTAVEIDPEAIKRGIQDARRLGVSNVTFVRGDVRLLGDIPDAELVSVDPPRAGLAKAVREAIAASRAERLLYVSCDAATWARDVAALTAAGFGLEFVQPFDFYPQTHHVEVLSLLTR